jgi:hypothetical protein
MSSNALVPHVPQALTRDSEHLSNMQRLGGVLAASGYFSDARDAAQAAVKVMAGEELGVPPIAAMMGINIIKGKIALGGNLIASRIRAHGYDYRIKRLDDTGCVLRFFARPNPAGMREELEPDVSFTEDDAKRAQCFSDMYRKYPRAMYFNRAISMGARLHTPEIFGGAPVYTPEELGADVDESGEYVPEEAPAPKETKAQQKEAQREVLERKLAETQEEKAPTPAQPAPSNGSTWDWKTVLVPFEAIEKTIGTEAYVRLLGVEGYTDLSELPDRETAKRVYKNVFAAASHLPPSENAVVLQPGHAAVAEPVKRAPMQQTDHNTMPADLEALWSRVFDIKSACTVLGELKKELYELAGEERGHQFYYTALAEFGAGHANDFKRNLGKARQCASRIWERIQLIKNPPAHNPEITDDDVPKGDVQQGVLEEAKQAETAALFEHQAFCEYAD